MTLFTLKWGFIPLVLEKKIFFSWLEIFFPFFSSLFLLVKYKLLNWQAELHALAFDQTKYWIQDQVLAEVLALNWSHIMETDLSKSFMNTFTKVTIKKHTSTITFTLQPNEETPEI